MTHIDPETLALLALSAQEPSPSELAHVRSCSECASELAGLQRAAASGRAARDVELVRPDAKVWARIQGELSLGLRPPVSPMTDDAQAAVPVAVEEDRPAVPESSSAPGSPPVPVHAATRRRRRGPSRGLRRRVWVPITAGVAVLALVAGVFASSAIRSVLPGGASERIVARALLDPFPSFPTAHGEAYLEESSDGSRSLVVDMNPGKASSAPANAPLREVWLLRRDAVGLVSVGFLSGDDGRFSIPDGVDLTQYRVVDISAEANDGNPGHSGLSIMRGDLEPRA